MTSALAGAERHEADAPIRVLIAEDETHLGTILEQFLTARGFFVRVVRDGRTALEELLREPFDVALLDVVMPEVDGLEVLRLVRERPVPPEIIVITGNGTIETAMAALKLGAYDFLSKPYRMAEIEALVRRAWEKRLLVCNQRFGRALDRRGAVPPLHTTYAPLVAVLDMVAKFAPSPLPVLVTGEAGTGRHSIARFLHSHGNGGAFVRLDCARLEPDEQVDRLFGAATVGATDAGSDSTLGALELAARGTVYLHDVEALGLAAQRQLLQALEAGTYITRAGGRRVLVDVRVVASTTRPLDPLVQTGRFDEQLLHRLSAMRVQLPALRERGADAVQLAQQFLQHVAGDRPLHFAPAALAAIERYRWPGNVRELRLAVERAAFLATHGEVSAAALGLAADQAGDVATSGGGAVAAASPVVASSAAGNGPVATEGADRMAASLADLERRHIADVLDRTAWHQGRAAEVLGISPKTLYRKIREYGFKRPSGRNQ